MAVGFDLDTVQAALAAGRRAQGVVCDDSRDVPIFHRLRKAAVCRFADRRRRHQRQPVARVVGTTPSQVRDLAKHCRIVGVTGLGQVAEQRYDLRIVKLQVAEGRRRIGGDDGRSSDHGHGDAALGLLDMIEPVALGRQTVFGVVRLVTGGDESIAQRQVTQLERLEEGVELSVAAHGTAFHTLRKRASMPSAVRQAQGRPSERAALLPFRPMYKLPG